MLVSDLTTVGNKLLAIRKHMGMTQAEVAEAVGMSDRETMNFGSESGINMT